MLHRSVISRLHASPFLRCVTASVTNSASGKTPSAPMTNTDEIPNLNFLFSKDNLLQLVQPTIEISTALLKEIPKAKNAKEKHDLIDTTSNVLCSLLDPCEFVRQAHPDPEYKQYANQAFQEAYEYMSQVNSRRDLYDVIAELDSTEGRKCLSEEEIKNVVQLKRDMESNGIHLPDKDREKIVEMNIEAEALAMRFLSDQGNPYSTLRNLLQCRYELAQLLGFESFAEKQLRGTMLENPQNVWHFLCGVAHKYRVEAEKEFDFIKQNVGEVRNRTNITDDIRARVAVSLRKEAEPKSAMEYFSVGNCIRGIKCLCSEVFGLTLTEVPFNKEEVYNKDAKKFHVYDEEKLFKGVIVLDLYMHEMKYCQAGHLTLQLGCRPHQEALKKVGLKLPPRQYPVVALTCNVGMGRAISRLPQGNYDEESILMTPSEVTTLFHEFGHALHTIVGQTEVHNLAGTRGSVDFVETFSQLFEQFLFSHEFLKLWAHRMNTREPISEDIVYQRNRAANLFKYLDLMDQVVLSAVDQALHGPQPMVVYVPYGDLGEIKKKSIGHLKDFGRGAFQLSKALVEIVSPLSVATPTETGVLQTLSFEHLSGYPASYYGYLYSLRVARRIWEKKFEQNPLNKDEGKKLIKEVMSHGAACQPVTVIENYLGDKLNNIDLWA